MSIKSNIDRIIKVKNFEELTNYIQKISTSNVNFSDGIYIAYGLHKLNRISDAIEVLSKIQTHNFSMIAVYHQTGIYQLETQDYEAAISNFERVISIEKRQVRDYCSPEAKFYNVFCHAKINSDKTKCLISKLNDDIKIFVEGRLWDKQSLIKLIQSK